MSREFCDFSSPPLGKVQVISKDAERPQVHVYAPCLAAPGAG